MICNVTHEFKNAENKGINILLHYDEVGSDDDYYVVIHNNKKYQFSNADDILKFIIGH